MALHLQIAQIDLVHTMMKNHAVQLNNNELMMTVFQLMGGEQCPKT
jgi:hypothetical protein